MDSPMGNPTGVSESFGVIAYLADKERTVRLIRWLLRTICLWPLSRAASIGERIFREFLIFMCYFLLFSMMVPCGLAIFIEERGNMETTMLFVGPFLYWIMSSIKYLCLILRVDDIRSCMECMETDWRVIRRDEDLEVMQRNSKIGRLMATCLAVIMHCGVMSFNITRCLIKRVADVGNRSVVFRELPFAFYKEIVDVRFSPAYEVTFIVQCISAFLVSGITIAICGLTAIFVMHACGQLEILTMRLYSIVDDDADTETLQRRLGFIVEHHLRVINFVSHIEEIIYLTCLVELMGCSLCLCLLGYNSIMAWNLNKKQNIPTYFMLSLSFILNIFVICYIGEILSEQYRQVGMATYMTKWHRLPRKIALGLLFINMRSNAYDTYLTAGKMAPLSLSTFGGVLKASLTYLNMLRAMTS